MNIKIPKKAAAALGSGWKYKKLTDAVNDIREDILIHEMKNDEVYEKYRPLCEKPFTRGSCGVLIRQWKIRNGSFNPNNRRRIIENAHKAKAIQEVKERVKEFKKKKREQLLEKPGVDIQRKISEGVAAALAKKVSQGAVRHFERMEAVLDKQHEVIATTKPTVRNIGFHLGWTRDWDGMARKLYRMDKQEEVNSTQFNLAVLLENKSIRKVEGTVFGANDDSDEDLLLEA